MTTESKYITVTEAEDFTWAIGELFLGNLTVTGMKYLGNNVYELYVNGGVAGKSRIVNAYASDKLRYVEFGSADDAPEVFNYLGMEGHYGGGDDWFERMLWWQRVLRANAAADANDPRRVSMRDVDFGEDFDNGDSDYWQKMYPVSLGDNAPQAHPASAEPLALTDADAPPAPVVTPPAFAIGDKVRVKLNVATSEKLRGVLTITDVAANDAFPYRATNDAGHSDIFEADELEPAGDVAATITVPLDAFDALLHDKREVEFQAELLSETLGEAVGNLRTERDTLAAKIAALEAEHSAEWVRVAELELALLDIRSYVQRPNPSWVDVVDMIDYALNKLGDRPTPPDDDPTPPAQGGGAADAPIALNAVLSDDDRDDEPYPTYSDEHLEAEILGTLRAAEIIQLPYQPSGLYDGNPADRMSLGDTVLAIYRDGAKAWAWAHDAVKAALLQAGSVTLVGDVPTLSGRSQVWAKGADAHSPSLHNILAAASDDGRDEGENVRNVNHLKSA